MIAIDTNVLVYAFNADEGAKYAKSRAILKTAFDGKLDLYIPLQVLGEFIAASTRKGRTPLSREQAIEIVRNICNCPNITILRYTEETLIRTQGLKAPFWDALITQTLLENGVRTLYTENTKDFVHSGIKAINIFA